VTAFTNALASYADSDQAFACALIGSDDDERRLFRVGEDDLFDIGSIAKTFTGVLLALLVERGMIEESTRARDLLPDGTLDSDMTLLSLATHRSGLPRLPPDLEDGIDESDPYAHYDAERMYGTLRALGRVEPRAEEYSNFGYMLLGHTLARAAGSTYADLIRQLILQPLGMHNTMVATPPATGRVQGHDDDTAVPPWSDPLPGAGGIWATLDDMTVYLRANIAPEETPIAGALTRAHQPRSDDGTSRTGLGWVTTTREHAIVWHNGGASGCMSFIGWRPDARVGCVAMHARFGQGLDAACARFLMQIP